LVVRGKTAMGVFEAAEAVSSAMATAEKRLTQMAEIIVIKIEFL
jgi:hypothetical protein